LSNPGKMMRSLPLAMLAVLCLCGPALAVDSGLEVQVNPVSAAGREILLYPGGQFLRVVPPLRQPGDTGAPVHLHLPARRARVASAAPRPAPAQPPVERPRPAPAPRVAAAPRPQPQQAAPPAAGPVYGAPPGAAGLFGSLPTISAAPPPPPKTQLASVAPPAAAPGTEGLVKQGVILFAHEADAPADSALDSIRLLAGQLNNSMTRAQSRVELMAYGGNKGDKGSDARRLSLKRALAIRQVLIDSGVSSARIDVHAQGGVDDTGPTDRVDVFVKS
jgi:outer membrane protein OmpA-like peptidoglycan-associated protein